MRLLLDTHALLWAVSAPGELAPRVRSLLEQGNTSVLVSAASAWEVAIKSALGKIDVDLRALLDAVRALGFAELAVSFEHAARAGGLPAHHRDPFDRLLVAQALEEGLTVVTRDPAFALYTAPTLWE